MTAHDAGSLLEDVDRIVARTRRAIVSAHTADHLVIWGLVWIAGFGASYFTSWHDGWIWLPAAGAGAVLSTMVGLRSRRIMESRDRNRVFLFLLVLVAFGAVWAILLYPFNVRHFGAYVATLFMFAYVAGGLWFGRFFVALGAAVTAMALAGVLFAPAHLDLVMAVAGGGSLLAAGLHIRRAWA